MPACDDGPGHGVGRGYEVDVVKVKGVPEEVALGRDGLLYLVAGRCDGAGSRRALERCVATRVLHGGGSYTATRMFPRNSFERGESAGIATLRRPGGPDRQVSVTTLVGIDPGHALLRHDRTRTIFVADVVCRSQMPGELEDCLRAVSDG